MVCTVKERDLNPIRKDMLFPGRLLIKQKVWRWLVNKAETINRDNLYVCMCVCVCVCVYIYIYRVSQEEGPNFGRVFLRSNYTDITQNTYTQSWTVTEIMAREKYGFLAVPRTVPVKWRGSRTRRMFLRVECSQRCDCVLCKVLGTLRTTTASVRVFM
jgi:hypothetical protein